MMPDLVIERQSGFADKFRAYEVRIDWCSSPEIALTVGPDDKHVDCGPNTNPLLSLLNLVFKARTWIWVREV